MPPTRISVGETIAEQVALPVGTCRTRRQSHCWCKLGLARHSHSRLIKNVHHGETETTEQAHIAATDLMRQAACVQSPQATRRATAAGRKRLTNVAAGRDGDRFHDDALSANKKSRRTKLVRRLFELTGSPVGNQLLSAFCN